MRCTLGRVGAAALALGLTGCGDDGNGDGAGGADAAVATASGFSVVTQAFVFGAGGFAEGAVGRIDGFTGLDSEPSAADGALQVPIPQEACGSSAFLIVEGEVPDGPALVPTVVLPELDFDCSEDMTLPVVGVLDADMRTTIASELAAAGEISAEEGASGEAFAAAYHWAYLFTADISAEGEATVYEGGTFTPNTHLPGICEVYYTNDYEEFRSGAVDAFVDTSLTNAAHHGALMVCEARNESEVAVAASGFKDAGGNQVSLTPVVVPMAEEGGAVFVRWTP